MVSAIHTDLPDVVTDTSSAVFSAVSLFCPVVYPTVLSTVVHDAIIMAATIIITAVMAINIVIGSPFIFLFLFFLSRSCLPPFSYCLSPFRMSSTFLILFYFAFFRNAKVVKWYSYPPCLIKTAFSSANIVITFLNICVRIE